MTRLAVFVAFGCLLLALTPPSAQGADIFPFPYKIERLDNGLTVVSIPLGNPNIIAYYTIVRSGSRNEVEPGKSGFAHFFEHMMFKGTKTVPRAAYDDFLTRLGAGTNGYTTDDYTCYYVVFAGRDNLESVVKTDFDYVVSSQDVIFKILHGPDVRFADICVGSEMKYSMYPSPVQG